KADVRYLFINTGLRARLLAYAARKHVPKDVISRAAAAMMSPKDVDLHDDHLHVRIACPESMREVCIEEAAPRDAAKAGHAGETAAAEEKASGGDARSGALGVPADAKPADGTKEAEAPDTAAGSVNADGADKDAP